MPGLVVKDDNPCDVNWLPDSKSTNFDGNSSTSRGFTEPVRRKSAIISPAVLRRTMYARPTHMPAKIQKSKVQKKARLQSKRDLGYASRGRLCQRRTPQALITTCDNETSVQREPGDNSMPDMSSLTLRPAKSDLPVNIASLEISSYLAATRYRSTRKRISLYLSGGAVLGRPQAADPSSAVKLDPRKIMSVSALAARKQVSISPDLSGTKIQRLTPVPVVSDS